jgi:hypothetical protein
MAGKRFTGFQNPVNPVILSKAQTEIVQTGIGTKALNATGSNPAAKTLRFRRGST